MVIFRFGDQKNTCFWLQQFKFVSSPAMYVCIRDKQQETHPKKQIETQYESLRYFEIK